MKQTAVDYLIEQIQIALKMHKIEITPQYLFRTVSPVFTKAKEIEKEQIVMAYHEGYSSAIITEPRQYDPEQYYNETYQPKPI